MAKHIYKGQGAPSFAPKQVGHHYVDILNGAQYMSKGTASSSDWSLLTPGTDTFVKVSASDTTAGYLAQKLIGVNNKITLTTLNGSGDEDLQINVGSHIFDKSVDTATQVVNTPAGGIASTNVQSAINELDTEKLNQNDNRLFTQNILKVKKNPGPGEFLTISSAIDSITTSSETNRYLIQVGPGVYTEPVMNVPSYTSITGSTINITTIKPAIANQHLFIMHTMVEISFLNLEGHEDSPGSGYAAIYCEDVGDFAQLHKISIYGFDIGISNLATDANSTIYCEYVDINGNYSYALKSKGENGYIAFSQAENFYTYPGDGSVSQIAVKSEGIGSELHLKTIGIIGGDDTTGIIVNNGGYAAISGAFIVDHSGSAIKSETGGVGPLIEISGTSFENNTLNLDIQHPDCDGNFTGFCKYLKINIASTAPFFVTNKDAQEIIVAKKGGDFSSVRAALAAITDNSASKSYVIKIGPGIFIESDTIVMKEFVDITGSGSTTILSVSDSTKDVIQACQNVTIRKLNIEDASSANGVNFNTSGAGNTFLINDCRFLNNQTHVNCASPTAGIIIMVNCTFNASEAFTTAIKVQGNSPSINQVIGNAVSMVDAASPFCQDFAVVSGTGATLILASTLINGGAATGSAIKTLNGGTAQMTASSIAGFAKGIYSENTGTGSIFKINATTIENCGIAVDIQHPDTTGFLNCSADRTLINIDADSTITSLISDPTNGGLVSPGELYLGKNIANVNPVLDLIESGAPMGKFDGGTLSVGSGLVVDVGEGFGYLMFGSHPNHFLKRYDWTSSSITLSANSSSYIYLNSSGIISSSTAIPSTTGNILLGRAITNSTTIDILEQTPFDAHHATNKMDTFTRNALGAIYDSGSLVTASGTRNLDISSGVYFYSANKFSPTGGAAATFQTHYRNGSGGWTRGSTTTVDNAKYDNGSGTLQNITTGNYVKHTLYVVGQGSNEKYLLVYGQELFSNLTLAEQGNIPSPPSWFTDSIVLIASIIVRGDGNASNTTYPTIISIKDERPIIGFKASGVSATSTHANLLGLAADDHTQYLLANGGRTLSGNLNMGGNSITNVNLVDGIDVTTHASRHLPNGSDPLTTSAPSSIGSANTEGIANAFARADHIHNHGNQSGGSTHSVATTSINGFMSSTDKTKLDGIATGATANSSDAILLNRANHTGTQTISTVSGLQAVLDAKSDVPFSYITTTTQSTSSTTYSNVTQLTSTSLEVGTYKFIMRGLFQSASTATGAGFRVGTGTAITGVCYGKWNISQAGSGTANNFQYDQLTSTTNVTSASVANANTNVVVTGEGVFTITTQGTIAIQFRSENGGAVTIGASSIFVIEKIG